MGSSSDGEDVVSKTKTMKEGAAEKALRAAELEFLLPDFSITSESFHITESFHAALMSKI